MLNNINITTLNNAIVLVLLGIALLIYIHVNDFSQYLNSALNIVVEIKDDQSRTNVNDFIAQLKNNESIDGSSIKYLSKDEALELMTQEINEVSHLDNFENPFKASIVFNLAPNRYSESYLIQLKDQLLSMSMVSNVYYQKELQEILTNNFKRLAKLSLIIALIFVVIAISMLYNGVKTRLIQDEQKINTMILVGAKERFIKRPYLQSSFYNGFFSAIIAIVTLAILLYALYLGFEDLGHILKSTRVLLSFFIILVIGILVSIFTTRLILNRLFTKIYIS